MQENNFLIIDGSSILYRAFFALPPLTNKRGEHTNAVYGFTNMFLGIMKKIDPGYVAVAFDLAAPTFRHLLYNEYKAHRESAPRELVEQINRVKDLIKAFQVPIFEIEGYEADDIIGTLACLAEKEGIKPYLFSGDTDLFQLISESTRVIMVRKGISDLKEYDLTKLFDKYGLNPEQMIDFKALKGDPSDNIPGVPGIGEKTALKLLHEYGSLDNILDAASNLKGKLRENLEKYHKQALLSRDLVKIKCDITDIDADFSKCRLKTPDYEVVREIYEELEFASLIKKLPEESQKETLFNKINHPGEPKKNKPELLPVENLKQIEELKNNTDLSLELSFHIETSDIYPPWSHPPQAVAFAFNNKHGYYIHPELIDSGEWLNILSFLFKSRPEIRISGHNLKKLSNIFTFYDIPEPEYVFDSLIAAYLLDPGNLNLSRKNIIKDYLKADLFFSDSPNKSVFNDNRLQKTFSLSEEAIYYFKLREIMEAKIKEAGCSDLYHNMEMPLSKILSSMELQGISVDKNRLNELSNEIKIRTTALQEEIFKDAGEEFNLNSPRQLSEILFGKLNMPVIKKTKTGYSTDVNVLEELAQEHEIASKILFYRQLVKLEGTYLSGLMPYITDEKGKIHTTYNQAITTTGRLSSSEPNLQNIPVRMAEGRRIREAFIPSQKGYIFLAADYSQIELRILAHISGDLTLVSAFNNDEDIHTRTAAEIFGVTASEVTSGMRKKAKAVNFGIVYGISDYGLGRDLKIPRKEAKIYIEKYFRRYYGVKRYMEEILVKARNQGYVTTIFNRRRYLPDINDKNFSKRSFAERIALNTPIQGSAADIIKLSMIRVYEQIKKEGFKARLLLQVHDELILELPENEKEVIAAMVKKQMEEACKLKVPLKVDISYGNNWYEL